MNCRTYSPEVLDNLVLLGVSAIIGMFLPVFDINIGNTANKKFKFALIKDVDEIGRNELIEPSYKGIELLLNPFLNSPLSDETILR